MRTNGGAETNQMTAVCGIERGSPLTEREKKVLLLVAEAQSNKEIAASLRISPSTVKRHLENILRKLGLKNRVEAAIYVLKMKGCPLPADQRPEDCPMRPIRTANNQRFSLPN